MVVCASSHLASHAHFSFLNCKCVLHRVVITNLVITLNTPLHEVVAAMYEVACARNFVHDLLVVWGPLANSTPAAPTATSPRLRATTKPLALL